MSIPSFHHDLQQLDPEERAYLAALAGLDLADQHPITPREETDMIPLPAHQARQLRQYFAKRDEMETISAPDAQSQARMLAKLHRSGVLRPDGQKASNIRSAHELKAIPLNKPAGMAQRIAALIDWLLPAGPGSGARHVLVAGAALAVMVVPVLIQQGQGPAEDNLRSTNRSTSLGQSPQVVLTANQAQTVQQLQTALQAAGLVVEIQARADGIDLLASVSSDQRAVVSSALAPWGLVLPSEGPLRVSIRSALGRQ
jgi:hypothetical protein